MQERCYYCNCQVMKFKQVKHGIMPKNARTRDHLVPVCRGGAATAKVVACASCNNEKGQLTVDEYRVVHAYRRNMLSTSYKFPGES